MAHNIVLQNEDNLTFLSINDYYICNLFCSFNTSLDQVRNNVMSIRNTLIIGHMLYRMFRNANKITGQQKWHN